MLGDMLRVRPAFPLLLVSKDSQSIYGHGKVAGRKTSVNHPFDFTLLSSLLFRKQCIKSCPMKETTLGSRARETLGRSLGTASPAPATVTMTMKAVWGPLRCRPFPGLHVDEAQTMLSL